MRTRRLATFAIVVLAAIAVTPAGGYIHFPPPTLPKMCEQSQAIRVLEVKKHDKDKGVVVFEPVETLKGKTPDDAMYKQVIGKMDKGTTPIFDWVADGKQAVMFTIEAGATGIACGYVFIDKYCYSVDRNGAGDLWLLIRVDPEMGAVYYGSVETLRGLAKDILAGKVVKVPVDESVKTVSVDERRSRIPALDKVTTENRKK